jgi:hypothetical protein
MKRWAELCQVKRCFEKSSAADQEEKVTKNKLHVFCAELDKYTCVSLVKCQERTEYAGIQQNCDK